jgi:hypothetical protein
MALTCIEKIIGLVIILIVFNLIFNSKSEKFSSGCGSMNCPCRRGGRCNFSCATANFGTPYDDNY